MNHMPQYNSRAKIPHSTKLHFDDSLIAHLHERHRSSVCINPDGGNAIALMGTVDLLGNTNTVAPTCRSSLVSHRHTRYPHIIRRRKILVQMFNSLMLCHRHHGHMCLPWSNRAMATGSRQATQICNSYLTSEYFSSKFYNNLSSSRLSFSATPVAGQRRSVPWQIHSRGVRCMREGLCMRFILPVCCGRLCISAEAVGTTYTEIP